MAEKLTKIRPVAEDDLASVEHILTSGIVDSETKQPITDEIADVLERIKQATRGELSEKDGYLVAEIGGEVLAVMGFRDPSETMRQVSRSDNPLEVVNAFVHPSARGQGLGEQMLDAVQKQAEVAGHDSLIVNSGPRYADAHPFYTKHFGAPIDTLEDHYGPGLHAPVWERPVTKQT